MKDNKNTKVEPDNFPIFNEKVVVDRLTLPKYDSFSKIDLYTEIYLLKNYEYSDKLVIGTHSLSPWKEIIEQSDKKNDFFTIFRVNTKPIYMQEVTMGKPKTFMKQLPSQMQPPPRWCKRKEWAKGANKRTPALAKVKREKKAQEEAQKRAIRLST